MLCGSYFNFVQTKNKTNQILKNNIKKTACFYVVMAYFLISSTPLSAQEVDSKLADALKHTLDSMRQILDVNGLSAAMNLSDNSIWATGSGVSTFSPVDSLTSEHLFETGSTTKTITAMCVLQLVDEGILSLEDSLSNWVRISPHIDSNITIRQLLRHESGVADLLLNPVFQPTLLQNTNQIWTAEEAIMQFIQPAVFQPGFTWGYSNTNYILLGMIIEAATGNAFEQELKDRFFTPMGLNSYINPAFDTIVEPYAHLWLDVNGDGIMDDAGELITNWSSLFSIIGPPGGYFATPTDLAIWIKESMSGNLVSTNTWQAAIETVPTSLPNNIRYGLGIMESQYLGLTALGHGGDLSYATQALYFPEKDISIVVAANDASIISWNLISTVQALLQTYIDCENRINGTSYIPKPEINTSVFPNPFTTEVCICIDASSSIKNVSISVLDVNGKAVWEEMHNVHIGENELTASLPQNIPAGVYFVEIKQNGLLLQRETILKK